MPCPAQPAGTPAADTGRGRGTPTGHTHDADLPAAGVLVVGYGNPLRGDDGAGWHVAAQLAEDPRLVGAEVRTHHQLVPELAADLAGADLVVLVDAQVATVTGAPRTATAAETGPAGATRAAHEDPGPPRRTEATHAHAGTAGNGQPARAETGPAGKVTVTFVVPDGRSGPVGSHHATPGALLTMAAALYGHAPPTWLVTVTAATLDGVDRLSPAVRAALPEMTETVVRLATGQPPEPTEGPGRPATGTGPAPPTASGPAGLRGHTQPASPTERVTDSRRHPHGRSHGMHELSLVDELVGAAVRRAGGRAVTLVRVRRASTLPEASLREAFALLSGEGPLSGAELEVEPFDVHLDCACGFNGTLGHDDLAGHMTVCPACGAVGVLGRTAELELLEVRTD